METHSRARIALPALGIGIPACLAWLVGSVIVSGMTMDTGPQRRLAAVGGILSVVWIVPALIVLLGCAAIARAPQAWQGPLRALFGVGAFFGAFFAGAATIGPIAHWVVP